MSKRIVRQSFPLMVEMSGLSRDEHLNFDKSFEVSKHKHGGKAHYTAARYDHKRGAQISRYVVASAKASSFKYEPDLSAATAKSGGVFGGTARFQSNNRARGAMNVDGRLIGNLKVKFLGERTATGLQFDMAQLGGYRPLRSGQGR